MEKERYFARFKGRDGRIRRLSILKEGFEGMAQKLTLAKSGISISEDNGEGILQSVRTWSGCAYVIDNGYLEDLYANMPHDLPISIAVEGGEVEWSGYVSTEVRSQLYPSKGTETEIPLCGKLATAGGFNLSEKKGKGMVTLAALLHEALILSGYKTTDLLEWPDTYGLAGKDCGLSLLGINVSRALFFSSKNERTEVDMGDADDTPMTDTAYEVLMEIAKLFGLAFYERGGTVAAISRFESNYRRIPIGDLVGLTTDTDFSKYALLPLIEKYEITQMEGIEQHVSKYQGKHSVTVEVKLSNIKGDLVQFDVDDFPFVNAYKRPLDYSNPSGGYKFLNTQVFECQNKKKDLRTYAYYRQSAGSGEDYTKGWFPLDSIKSAQWYYGYKQGRESKPGCFPARISISEPNEYYDKMKPGGSLTEWLTGHSYNEGFVFNPSYYENGECGMISWDVPIIKMEVPAAHVYSKGTFALHFSVGAFPVCGADKNSPDPKTPYCRFFVELKCGKHKFMSLPNPQSYPMYGWQEGTGEPSKIFIPMKLDNKDSFPESLSVKDSRGSDRMRKRSMPNILGMTFPCWDTEENEVVLNGKIELTLYANANGKSVDEATSLSRMIFISDLKFEFVSEDQYPDGYSPRKNEDVRTLHKLTTKGFKDRGETVSLRMGSMSADNSSSMSALMVENSGLEVVEEIHSGVTKAPEEFLLSNLFHYYDRIVERRELVIKQDALPEARALFTMDGKQWRQVATAENYGEGNRIITIEEA